MNAKATIDAILQVDGVFGAFFSSHRDRMLIAKVPPQYGVDHLHSLAKHGERLLESARRTLPECDEVQVDHGHVSLLLFLMPGGIVYVMAYKPKIMEMVRAAVQGLCQVVRQEERRLLLTTRIPAPQLPGGRACSRPDLSGSVLAVGGSQVIAPPRYVDEVTIGEGGTSVVFKAYDTRMQRMVALKRYKTQVDRSSSSMDYLAELASASRIQHLNVVGTYDADFDEFGCFLVMEYIRGEDLEMVLRKGAMDLKSFLEMAEEALEGVAATHAGGFLHLDLKPSNLMLAESRGGRRHLKLIDYGRARLLEETPRGSGLSGSIYYASPEYLSENEVDGRSDLYSLGCLFYHALTGTRPFTGDSILVIMSAHLRHQVKPLKEVAPHLPGWLVDWVTSLMQPKPADRPESAKQALDGLLRHGTENRARVSPAGVALGVEI